MGCGGNHAAVQVEAEVGLVGLVSAGAAELEPGAAVELVIALGSYDLRVADGGAGGTPSFARPAAAPGVGRGTRG